MIACAITGLLLPLLALEPTAAAKTTKTLKVPARVQEFAPITATTTFTPAKPGTKVVVQLKSGSSWTKVAQGKQNAKGKTTLTFRAPIAGTYFYRARTINTKGKITATTAKKRVVVTQRKTRLVSRPQMTPPRYGQANRSSGLPSISGNGRWVAYSSSADNLVKGDLNKTGDVFLTDTKTGKTLLVSRTPAGKSANRGASSPSISANGRYVVFESRSDDMVAGEAISSNTGIYRFDRVTKKVVRVTKGSNLSYASISDSGNLVVYNSHAIASDITLLADLSAQPTTTTTIPCETLGNPCRSRWARISADGKSVALASTDSRVGATPSREEIFVYDVATEAIERVSPLTGDNDSGYPDISANGRYVVYQSEATNLIAGETNTTTSLYRYDRVLDQTVRVSKAVGGGFLNIAPGRNLFPRISGDGSAVAYISKATNISPKAKSGLMHAYVFSVSTGKTALVSVTPQGKAGNGASDSPVLSHNGKIVAFQSVATNLVPLDKNAAWDVFRRAL